MGLLGQTLVLYLLVGVGVAVAVYLSDLARGPGERAIQVLTALPFWPLYLPLLLSRGWPETSPPQRSTSGHDDLAAAIARADADLQAALKDLDGWAAAPLLREKSRLGELRAAWEAQAERLRTLDGLLAQADGAEVPATSERLRQSRQAWRQNIERLRQVRQQAHDDLLASLARVYELVSLIHLARYTDAPPARTEELLARIQAAVEVLAAADGPQGLAGGGT